MTLINPRSSFVERIRLHQMVADAPKVLADGIRLVVDTVTRIDAAGHGTTPVPTAERAARPATRGHRSACRACRTAAREEDLAVETRLNAFDDHRRRSGER
ncbi:hypothetical protein [Actinomadura kijaniata]|uniref:hypothetical protein n=1 Tax=Actinomadura kijaniata TaxID=46161 RepID=UPI003F52DA97